MEKTDIETMKALLHEIKNPITALMFQCENLKAILPHEYLSEVESMDTEIQRLADLVKEAGDYYRDPVGSPERINLKDFLGSMASSFSTDIELSFSSDVTIGFDRNRARSVFENLIKNACESNGTSGAKVRIEVSQTHDKAVVKIMDRGEGLNESVTEHLFNFGYTTKTTGSGIGLFLVKHFIEAQCGSIKLYNREGGGVIAEVTLPLYQEN